MGTRQPDDRACGSHQAGTLDASLRRQSAHQSTPRWASSARISERSASASRYGDSVAACWSTARAPPGTSAACTTAVCRSIRARCLADGTSRARSRRRPALARRSRGRAGTGEARRHGQSTGGPFGTLLRGMWSPVLAAGLCVCRDTVTARRSLTTSGPRPQKRKGHGPAGEDCGEIAPIGDRARLSSAPPAGFRGSCPCRLAPQRRRAGERTCGDAA